MKTFTKTLTTLTLSLSVLGMANASTFIAKDNSVTTELCMTAASGNRIAMSKAIKNSRISKLDLVNKVKCNEQNITDFVAQYGNSPTKMNLLINRSIKKGSVTINDIASL